LKADLEEQTDKDHEKKNGIYGSGTGEAGRKWRSEQH
jgi:hypothetical protein